jgi:membrane protein implicated in regulation of membrane protease activity
VRRPRDPGGWASFTCGPEASAAFQVGIVLCSAAIITGMMILAWLAGGVAMIGIGLMGLGLFAPHLLHFG